MKREIRHFHVVVGQQRQRNVQKSVKHMIDINLFLFQRPRCRRLLAGPVQTPDFSWAEPINSNKGRLKLFRLAELIQAPLQLSKVQKAKNANFQVKLLTKYVIIIYALGSVHEKFGLWIKAVPENRSLSPPRVAFSRVGWFSRALSFRSLYYP